MIPGEIIITNTTILCNKEKRIIRLSVLNDSHRPIQVGSHYHFFEVNRKLKFDREKTYGMRLNIPSGIGLRFEPGEEKEVELVEFGGEKTVYGLNNLTCGNTVDPRIKETALKKAMDNGFREEVKNNEP